MDTCILVSAGDFLPERFHKEDGDIVIAADNGFSYLAGMGLEPDYCIGDYDSLEGAGRDSFSRYAKAHPERVRTLPCRKDDTDTLAAIRWGMELGYRRFCLYGALGGSRLDHTIANIQSLLFIKRQGGDGIIVGNTQTLYLLSDEAKVFPKGRNAYLSLFALDPKVFVTITGMAYEAQDMEITSDFPIGCSNHFLEGKEACIAVKGGAALLVASF